MPTYDYRCTDCGHEFEVVQKMSARHLRKCPECAGILKRLIGTGAGIIFKGSGFYETDYRSDAYNSAAEKEKKAATGTDKKSDTDSKTTKTKESDSKKAGNNNETNT